MGFKFHSILIFILSIAMSSVTMGNDYPQRALIDPEHIEEAISLAKKLNHRRGKSIPEGQNWFEVLEGSIPVIITAPHATGPFRNGKRRFSDGGGTAALAVELNKLTGVHVIYTTYEGPSDPNYYDDNTFKTTLAKLMEQVKPKYVLDIHGSSSYRSYDVDLGTMDGASLLGNENLLFSLIEHLKREGIVSISYNRFAASQHHTITRFSHQHEVPAIQLEINETYVSPSNGKIEAQRFSRLLQTLTRFIGPKDAE